MIVEYIYPLALLLLLISSTILIIFLWWGYKHIWYNILNKAVIIIDNTFYFILDKLMGKHETY